MFKSTFHNYFLHKFDEKYINKLKNLITKNVLSILKKSELSYISSNTSEHEISKQDFFLQLVNKIEEDLAKYCIENGLSRQQYELELFLGGGSIRSILGSIYENLYKKLSKKEAINQEKIKYIEELYEEFIQRIQNNQLKSYLDLHVHKPSSEISLDQTGSIWKKQLKSFFIKKFNELLNNSNSLSETEIAANIKEIMKYKQQLTSSSVFALIKSQLEDEKFFAPGLILGVGSDLDLYYRLKVKNNSDQDTLTQANEKLTEVKLSLEDSAKDFINSAREHYNLRFDGINRDEFVDAILPQADVKEIDQQITRAVTQGGSLLDVLAFKLDPKLLSGETKDPMELSSLWEGPKLEINLDNNKTVSGDNIVDHILMEFIRGYYDYISPREEAGKFSFKQTIRGLRALTEIPFLRIKDEDRIKEELSKKLSEDKSLSLEERKQINKLQRNSRFSGGNNGADVTELMSLFLKIIEQHNNKVTEEEAKVYFKSFIELLPLGRPISGKYGKELEEYLISKEQFIKEYTNDGMLYHGTGSIENVIPILI